MLGTPENPPLLARKVRAVKTREVRTISRKDHVQAAAVSDDYLYGLIDGEGMFHVGIVPSTYTRLGWQVIYQFKVAQNPVGEPVLRALQERLGCGTISPNARAVSIAGLDCRSAIVFVGPPLSARPAGSSSGSVTTPGQVESPKTRLPPPSVNEPEQLPP